MASRGKSTRAPAGAKGRGTAGRAAGAGGPAWPLDTLTALPAADHRPRRH
jgi:hypothetical protein